MNIGQMIEALAYVSNDAIIRNAGKQFCSYRGYYEHLAICEAEETPVKEFKRVLRLQVGETYKGWIGGEYLMNLDTELFIAPRGSWGKWVVGVGIDQGGVFLLTSETDMYGV